MVSDAELAEAVRADLVTMMTLLHGPPIGEVEVGTDAIWFRTGEPSPYSNGVLHATLRRNDLDAAIERRLEPFKARDLPMMWWRFVPPESSGLGVDAALRRHGLALDADRPGFGMELVDLRVPDAPAEVAVARVRDTAAFPEWVQVVSSAFDDPAFAERPSVEAFRLLGFGDDAPFRHFVCRVERLAVGSATLSLGAGAGVAGLGNIAVVPAWRRRGIGATVAATALLEARALGLRVAALSADPAGEGLYIKLGFREVSRHRTYIWSPEP